MGVMNNLVMESNGSKRSLSGIISALGLITSGIPALSVVTTVLAYLGGILGLTGIVHAGKESTMTVNKTSTLAAIFSVVLSLCYAIPSLNQYAPLVQEIAGFLGIGVGAMSVAKSPA